MKSNILLASFFSIFLLNSIYCQDINKIKNDLNDIYSRSISLRSKLTTILSENGYNSYKFDSITNIIAYEDSLNLIFVEEILCNYGWLGKSIVGNMANQSIFFTIQHAKSPLIRQKYLHLLQESVSKNESFPEYYALMIDRIKVENNEKQIYGTQYVMIDGKVRYFQIENLQELNKKRKELNLKKLKLKKIEFI